MSIARKILIFGNSGSGKSTLAKALGDRHRLNHLDLDTLAWEPVASANTPPKRKSLNDSAELILEFTEANNQWVIEGCYTDLLSLLVAEATEMIYLNLSVAQCIENARQRPWEPHKYESKAAQDANLGMLIDWIAEYEKRQDTFSSQAHLTLYQAYQGDKKMLTKNSS